MAIVRGLATISYSMYLSHLLVRSAVERVSTRWALPAGVAVAVFWIGAILVAAASYRWIEHPFIRMYRRESPRAPAA